MRCICDNQQLQNATKAIAINRIICIYLLRINMTKYTPTITSTSFACALVSFMNKQISSVDASSNLEILHMNDHHSYLAPKSLDLFGEDIPSALNSSTISKISINYGGMPLIKALIDSIEEDNTDGSLLKLHCGDAIVGTPFFTVSHLYPHLSANLLFLLSLFCLPCSNCQSFL